MKPLVILLATAAILAAQEPPAEPAASPRSRALELAGAFANDGYKIRDGFWTGTLEPGKPKVLQVNLFSGNEYWFSAATLSPKAKLTVGIYDESGRPVEGELFQDGSVAAAGLAADASGKYFIRVALAGEEKADFCLVYSYK